MIACKNCQNTHTVKNGFVRDTQRYKCKMCGYNFVLGDERRPHTTEIKKALCIILSSLGTASFGFVAKLFGVSRTTTYDWIRQAASIIDEPALDSDIQEIECAEMWHFIQSTKEKSGLLKPWIVAQGEPWPGCSVVVMRQRSNGSTTHSNI
jgi:transposase